MKKIYPHFHLSFLAIFLSLFTYTTGFAQCSVVSQGTANAPTCSYQALNGGAGAYWDLPVTGGVNYSFYWVASGCSDNTQFCVNAVTSTATSGTPYTAVPAATGTWAVGFFRANSTWCGTSAALNYKITAPTATQGGTTSATVCASTNSYMIPAGYGATVGTISWSSNGDGTFTSGGTTTTPTYTFGTVDKSVGGVKTLTMTVNNGGCTATTTFSLSITPAPTATQGGTTSASICASANTYTIPAGYTASSYAGTTISWSSSGDGTFTNGTTTTPTYNFGANDIANGGVKTLTMTVASSPCASATATFSLSISKTPTATQGGTTLATICANANTYAIPAGYNATNGTVLWTTSGDGTFINGTTTTPTYTFGTNDKANGGTKTLTMTVTNSPCTSPTATFALTIDAMPTAATVGATQNVCGSLTSASLGGNTPTNGTGTWTQTGGPGTVSFSAVNSGSSTATVSLVGTYTFAWTIANGTCPSSVASITVNYYTAPTTASVGPNQTLCSATLVSGTLGGNTAIVGTGTWTQLSGPSVTTFSNVNDGAATATVSVQGTYIYTWTIANGPCSSSANDTVIFYSPPTTASVGSPQNLCGTLTSGSLAGNNPGIGTGLWTQAAGPGTTIFSNPTSGSSTATASIPGAYTYKWTISNGTCASTSDSVKVTFIATPSGGSIANTSYCSSVASGTVSVTGVTNASQYQWALPAGLSGSSTTSSITVGGTVAGSYTVTVTPQNIVSGVTCTGTPITGVVRVLALPVIDSVRSTALSCFGGSNSTITVYGHTSNGVLHYSTDGGTTYPSSTGIFSGLGAGSYNVAVSDDSTCATVYGSNPIVVTSPPDIFLSIASFGNVRCNGDSSGFIDVSASGGTGAFTYLWSNGATSQNISHLEAGTFTLTVTDANSCNKSISQTLTEPVALSGTISSTNISCFGANDGSASFAVTGGVTPYSYLWSNANTTNSISGLAPGVYSVTATDNSGCIAVGSANITSPLPVTISLSVNNVACFNAGNGQITANVTGGTGAYTYTWSPNVSTTNTVTNAAPGTYIVTVSDVNSCSAVDSATVTQPLSGLSVSSVITPVGCTGGNSGAIQLLASGGVGGYTYIWSSGQTIQLISGLSAGIYNATVTDGNGCQVIVADTLVDPTPIVSSVAGTSSICAGAGGGSATLTVSGGVPAYTFLWSNFETTQNLSNLSGGLYRVIITDANGCEHRDSVTITQPLPIIGTITASNVTCTGANNGTITVNATGGTGAYTYSWTPNVSTTNTVTNASPGTYVVTVTDVNGCTFVDSFTITQPASAPAVTTTVTDITCNGANNGSITTQVSGGSGSYTYSWTGGATTPSLSGLSAGTYDVTVTDANGCTATSGGTLTDPAAITSTTTGTNVTCAGSADGTATVATLSGGTGPYTFLWTNFAATQTISGLSGGLYRVIITDAHGCEHRDSVFITEPQPIVVTLTSNNISCAGAGNGTITANTTGGTGAYTYAWTGSASTTNTVTNATAGTYTVTVTDASGCTGTATTTITQPQGLSDVLTGTNVLCYGGNTGSVHIAVSGGSGVYTYQWSPGGATTSTISNLTSGTYYVTVTDAGGCTLVDSAKIIQPTAPILITAVVHNVTCNGANDGSILVVASGGTGSYTYQWSTGQTTQYVHNLSASPSPIFIPIYVVTVTDANGCTAVFRDTLKEPNPIVTSIVATDVTCAEASNGSAVMTISGGVVPYSYLWSNFTTDKDLSNVPGGTYTVIVTDSNHCQHTDSITIHEPLPIVITLNTTNVNCFGANNGGITATVTGGTGAYTYAWTGSASTTNTVSNASPGTYTVTVTDANGCTSTATTTITQPVSGVNVVATVTDITCNNANNGSITTQVSGGTGSYIYSWTGGATTPSLTGLSAGTYNVTVTDANGCTGTAGGTITNPSPITSTTTGTNVTCAGAADGTASVATISGGTAPYTYLWSNFAATQTISGLSGGLYRVIITDAHGCEQRDSVFVTEPTALTATVASTNVHCFAGADGTITLTVSGGTGAYTYTWSSGGSTGPTATGLAPGTYTVTVKDANNCSLVESATITQPASGLIVQSNVVNISCNSNANGSISLSVSGGTPAYTFDWSSGQHTQIINGLSAGIYTATVTDANGCSVVVNDTVRIGTAITSSIVGTNVTCAGADNGTAQLTVGGGQTPYTFLWSTFAGTQNLDSLSGGLYYVIITDANGCQHRDSILITEPQPVAANLAVTPISCNNSNDGAITAAGTGGTGALSYLWSPGGQTTATISGLSANTYTVTVKDVNNCSVTASATLTNPAPLSVANVVINPRCNGSSNGTITLIVNGGTPQYNFTWSGALAGSGQSATNVAPGNYNVTVTDSHGCSATDSANVIAPAPIYVSGIITNVKCNGNSDGSAIVTVYGGVLPYSYQWHYDSLGGALGPITKDWTQLPGGDYYLAITDVNNCSASYHAVIKEADSLKVTLSKTDLTCFGSNNGTTLASVRGGTVPYHYLWNNFLTDSTLTGLAAGNYGVVVTDSNGCQVTKTINVGQPQPIFINVTATNPACSGSATGSISLAVSGGSGSYTYLWSTSPAQTTNPATGLTAGTYYMTVTDGNGCTQIDSATLTAPQALVVNTAISNPTCSDGNNGFVSLDVHQGTAPYSYSWNTTPTQTGNVASGLVGGTYIVTITDAGGCQMLDTAVVVAPQPIVVSLGTLGSSTCLNTADGYAVVSVTGGLAPYTYQLGSLTQNSDTFTNLTPGTYALTVRDANGCQGIINWTIYSASSFTVDLTVDHDVILAGETIQLTATPTSDTTVLSYSWTPGDSLNFSGCGSATDCPTPTAMPTSSLYYIVVAQNAKGCIATDTVHITVSNQESAFMPSAFTPNGDGVNDKFTFDILGAKTVDVQIWNRWGEKVYSNPAQKNGTDAVDAWDGSFRGKVVEFDSYTYQFVVTYIDGHQKTLAGTVTVMR